MENAVGFTPLFERVMIKPDEVEKRTETGIILPVESRKRPNTGIVVEVRPKRLPYFKVGKELKERMNDKGVIKT